MVGFILACAGHRYRAVAGSNPALPTILNSRNTLVLTVFSYLGAINAAPKLLLFTISLLRFKRTKVTTIPPTTAMAKMSAEKLNSGTAGLDDAGEVGVKDEEAVGLGEVVVAEESDIAKSVLVSKLPVISLKTVIQ